MCLGSSKTSSTSSSAAAAAAAQQIPIRQPVLLPDNGDPSVVMGLKNQRRLTGSSMMMLTGNGGTLGSPSVTGPIGAAGM
jgi:hypothetical protein